jgi:hypothetical protein
MRIVGFEEQRIAIYAFGLIEFAHLAQHIAEIAVRLRIVELDRQGLPIRIGGLIEPARVP